MEIPTTLRHKPVIFAGDYGTIDGRYAGASDAQALSLGLAQWNDRGKVEISAKVWRHTGEKWSRQSEELPLHRVLDLAILICQAKVFFSERHHYHPEESLSQPQIEKIPLQGGKLEVEVCLANEQIREDLALFDRCLAEDDELLGERVRRLRTLLEQLP